MEEISSASTGELGIAEQVGKGQSQHQGRPSKGSQVAKTPPESKMRNPKQQKQHGVDEGTTNRPPGMASEGKNISTQKRRKK